MTFKQILLPAALIACASCGQKKTPAQVKSSPVQQTEIRTPELPKEDPRIEVRYHFEKKAIWKEKESFEGYGHMRILAAVNRVDEAHLPRLDSFLVPDQYPDTSVNAYMPFPSYSGALKEIKKIILFSYPAQAFAAYEYGKLVISGPTNMGKKASKTPTGLFFCNWKSKETRSTVDEEWILKWNFNVSNIGGVGFHQYDLPGYPASHSCMRLWADQAEFLYYWAEQWKLSGSDQLLAKGTPVVIFGVYPFGKPRPWFALAEDSGALDISDQQIAEIIQPYRESILKEQQKRAELFPPAPDTTRTTARL